MSLPPKRRSFFGKKTSAEDTKEETKAAQPESISQDEFGARAWSPGENSSWKLAKIVRRDAADGTICLEEQDGSESKVSEKDLQLANADSADGEQNMVVLQHLNEPALLHNLNYRFTQRLVYTYSGMMLISINPFDWSVTTPMYAA